jgi:hypothetical protein
MAIGGGLHNLRVLDDSVRVKILTTRRAMITRVVTVDHHQSKLVGTKGMAILVDEELRKWFLRKGQVQVLAVNMVRS